MALEEGGSPSMSRADVSARDSNSAITRIQAHARGNQARKGSCNMVDNLVQRLTPTGAASKVKETGEMAAQVAARTLSPAVKAASTISAELLTDLASRHIEIKQALENHLEFSFLASDTHPMHGLQDWSTAEWAEQIEQYPELSALLANVRVRVRGRVSLRRGRRGRGRGLAQVQPSALRYSWCARARHRLCYLQAPCLLTSLVRHRQ